MTEAEGGSRGKNPEFDFDLAEKQFREIDEPEIVVRVGSRSLAGYQAYAHVQRNKMPDSNHWNGQPNSPLSDAIK